MKIGVIDVGGGLRGIYAVGVFDYCMDHDIHFDLGIGISAGSANLHLLLQAKEDALSEIFNYPRKFSNSGYI